MRSARWFFVVGVLLLVTGGTFADTWFSGILLAGGLGAIAGALNAFLGGLNDRES